MKFTKDLMCYVQFEYTRHYEKIITHHDGI
jgi:hypothetical protein